MNRTFIPALSSSAALTSLIFITTMLTSYKGIDYPFLLYAIAFTAFVSTASAYFVSNIIKDSRVGASVSAVLLTIIFFIFLAIVR